MTVIMTPPPAQVQFADMLPMPEAKAAKVGTLELAPRADHQHPRLTSAQVATLDNTGTQTIVFTRTFSSEPAISMIAVENDTKSPPDFKVKSFAIDGSGNYTGCTVYATRARALPVVAALLTDLLKLSGYVPTEPAAGVKFSIIALQAS